MELNEILVKISKLKNTDGASKKELGKLIDTLLEEIEKNECKGVELMVDIHLEDGTHQTMNIRDFYRRCKDNDDLDHFREVVKKIFIDSSIEKYDMDKQKAKELVNKLRNGEELSDTEQAILDAFMNTYVKIDKFDYFVIAMSMVDIYSETLTTNGMISLSDLANFMTAVVMKIISERYEHLPASVHRNAVVETINTTATTIREKIGKDMIENVDPVVLFASFMSIMGVVAKRSDQDINFCERFSETLEKYEGKAVEGITKALVMYSAMSDPKDAPERIINSMSDTITEITNIIQEREKEEEQEGYNDTVKVEDEELRKLMKGK